MTTTTDLLKAGYVCAPNNIWSLPGNEWYACGPGLPTVKHSEEIRLINGELSIWTTKYYQRPDSTFNFHISGIVTEINNLDHLKQYCLTNGRISEPGLPAFLHGFD